MKTSISETRFSEIYPNLFNSHQHNPILSWTAVFAETFIDPGRFRGTCYRAANWQLLGLTTGRGKNDQTNKPNRTIKEILGLPLTPRFREYLSQL